MQIQGEENRGCPYEYQNGKGSFFRMHYPLKRKTARQPLFRPRTRTAPQWINGITGQKKVFEKG